MAAVGMGVWAGSGAGPGVGLGRSGALPGLSLHPGCMHASQWSAALDRLDAEATALADKLAARPGIRVWLFTSDGGRYGAQVTRLLRPRLDAALERVEARESAGTFYDTIVEYRVP